MWISNGSPLLLGQRRFKQEQPRTVEQPSKILPLVLRSFVGAVLFVEAEHSAAVDEGRLEISCAFMHPERRRELKHRRVEYAVFDLANLYVGPQLLESYAFKSGKQMAMRVFGMQQSETVAQTAQK